MRQERAKLCRNITQIRDLAACFDGFNDGAAHIQRLAPQRSRSKQTQSVDIHRRPHLSPEVAQLFRRDIFEFSGKLPGEFAVV